MSDRNDALEQMQNGLAKLIAQSFTFGNEVALWSANRVLDVAEAVADAAAPSKKATPRSDDRRWSDDRLERLRRPPLRFAIDLSEEENRWLDSDLSVATGEASAGKPGSGEVPERCRQAFERKDQKLSADARMVGVAAGARGRRWMLWDEQNELIFFSLQNKRESLKVTPVVRLALGGLDPSRLGTGRSLVAIDREVLDRINTAAADAGSSLPPLTGDARVVYLGDPVIFSAIVSTDGREMKARANIWKVVDGDSMVLVMGAEGEELEGYLLGIHFRVPVSKEAKWVEALDRAELPEALREQFGANGFPLSGSSGVLGKGSAIRWQIDDPGEGASFTLINGGDQIMVFGGPAEVEEVDQYVDPVGDRVAEHFLELANPGQRAQHLILHLLAGDVEAFVSEADLLAEGRPFEVLRWLRGQAARIEPMEAGPRGSLEMFRDFFVETAKRPPWVDGDLLAEGEEAFDLYKIPYMTALLFGALPETYGCWKGAQVLTTTGRLAIDPRLPRKEQLERLHHRVAATAQFVLNIMEEGAFDLPDGIGLKTTQTLRLLHAGVRFVIRNVGPGRDPDRAAWDYERLGRPINQEDMLGTMLAFSTVTFDKLRELNVKLSDRQEKALFHRWKLMGFYLGIREDLLNELETVDDGRYLWSRIAERQQKYEEPTDKDSRGKPDLHEAQNCADLTRALIEYTRTVTTVGMPAEMSEYLVRYFAGQKLADRLSVPETDLQVLARAATLLGRANLGAIQVLKDNSSLARDAFTRLNEVVYRAGFDTWISEKPVTYYRSGEDGDGEQASEPEAEEE